MFKYEDKTVQHKVEYLGLIQWFFSQGSCKVKIPYFSHEGRAIGVEVGSFLPQLLFQAVSMEFLVILQSECSFKQQQKSWVFPLMFLTSFLL